MSEIRATTISDAAGTGPVTLTGQSAAKAWVNFNGTGTIAIRDSFNVSGLVDLATGRYQVSYTNAMSDGNNSVVSGVSTDTTGTFNSPIVESVVSTSTIVQSRPDRSDSYGDSSIVTAHTMGGLA